MAPSGSLCAPASKSSATPAAYLRLLNSALLEGRLLTHSMPNEGGNSATLEAIGNNLPENELLPRRYHARLISIADAEWRLRGLERLADGREVLQEWVCQLL